MLLSVQWSTALLSDFHHSELRTMPLVEISHFSLLEMRLTLGHFRNFQEISQLSFSCPFRVAITCHEGEQDVVTPSKCEAHIFIGLVDVATLFI
jgi:hypothetical protein